MKNLQLFNENKDWTDDLIVFGTHPSGVNIQLNTYLECMPLTKENAILLARDLIKRFKIQEEVKFVINE